jgi:hypothetical protein
MNTVRTSVEKNQNLLSQGFFNSLFYTFPIGMFLTACNFLFESVRNYYFDWWIVALPTVGVLVIGNLYETFWMYQRNGLFTKREKSFRSKQVGYITSNANLATS